MLESFRNLSKISQSRLTRRIVFWVFVCVIAIETIIFIPSFNNRKKELLSHLREVSQAKISAVCLSAPDNAPIGHILHQLDRLRHADESIQGGVLFQSNGSRVGEFGDAPTIEFSDITEQAADDSLVDDRYDAVFPLNKTPDTPILVVRIDASSVKNELYAFILRIGGLVVIISIFVTVGAWIALNPIVVSPILRLREDLIAAGEAVQNDGKVPDFQSASIQRKDELGEVITAFMETFHQITDAISERKRAERLLQESLTQVQAYSTALNNELEQGRRIQQNFFPSKFPDLPGWEFSAFFKPARQVAGDFYDVFELPGDHIGIVVADVCDKGVGAALFMALFRSLIRIFSGQTILEGVALSNDKPAPVFTHSASYSADADTFQENALHAVRLTNNYIAQNHGDLSMFATLFFGVLDPATGVLTYINSGHEPPYVVGAAGTKKRLDPNGPAVGAMANQSFTSDRITLEPGDILIGYTDGITEALSSEGKLYTKKRLEAIFEQSTASASELLDRIKTSLFSHVGNAEQEDDMTLLGIQRRNQ
jgi:serine phosphatase RsbU (regulator of sigma subunit)